MAFTPGGDKSLPKGGAGKSPVQNKNALRTRFPVKGGGVTGNMAGQVVKRPGGFVAASAAKAGGGGKQG